MTVELPIEQWSVCLPDHHPGYVSWDEYRATRVRLRGNVILPGQGGGPPREGAAVLQGLLRCGRCGRRMQVAYSGTNGRVPRYACVRAHQLHGTEHACQSLGGLRLEKAITAAFLQAVTPAGLSACTQAIGELERAHQERRQGQELAVERADLQAARARRQYDACEPENRLVARTLEARLEAELTELERERRVLAELDGRRPQPLSPTERQALQRLTRDLPRLWSASTTSARDRKELLRTLISEIIVTVQPEPRRAEVEILWEGGARTELSVQLVRRGPESKRTDEDTVVLIGRLAAHHPDRQIAAILNKQGRRTGTGLPFTAARVWHVRHQHDIPTAPPPDPGSDLCNIDQAALQLGVTPTARSTVADPVDRRGSPALRSRGP